MGKSQEAGSRAGTTSDRLVFASGFEVGTRYARRSGYETVGRDVGYPGSPVALFEYIDRRRQSCTFDSLDLRVRSRASQAGGERAATAAGSAIRTRTPRLAPESIRVVGAQLRNPGDDRQQGVEEVAVRVHHREQRAQGEERTDQEDHLQRRAQPMAQQQPHRFAQRAEQRGLAASEDRVAGMMLQRMPDQQGMDADAWNRAAILADTIRPEELLQIPANDLLLRLFHEETLRRFEQEPLAFACSCSREKVGDMLQSLGKEEIDSILAEHGEIEIACEFCGREYRFDAVEAAQLFTASRGVEPAATKH